MTVTQETVVPAVLDSALLRADLEALLDALRYAEDYSFAWSTSQTVIEDGHWGRVLERADLLRQSYALARARVATGATQGEGAGR